MKYLLLIISLLFVSLIGIKETDTELSAFSQVQSVQQLSNNTEDSDSMNQSLLASDEKSLFGDMFLLETPSLVRHLLNNSNRFSRTTTLCYISYNKYLLRLMSMLMEALGQRVTAQISSMPRLGWSFASDHYVFGMRRILI